MKQLIQKMLILLVMLNAVPAYSTDYERAVSDLLSLHADAGRTAKVENIIIKREGARFDLHHGEIQLLSRVNDRYIAFLFTGQGTFRFTPPTKIERAQLRRFYDSDSLDESFNTLMMLFNDSTLAELERKLNFSPGEAEREGEKIIEDILAYLSDKDANYFRSPVLKFLLDGSGDPYFYAHFYKNRAEPFFFEINPYEYESVRFMHRAELGHIYKYPEIICQYPASHEDPGQLNDVIKIGQFEIDSRIADDLEFTGTARLKITSLKNAQEWLYFNIYQKMEIDSVIINDTSVADFFKPEDMSVFWVNCGKKLTHGEHFSLTIHYHSDEILERDTRSWIYLKSPLYWYPRYALWEPAIYQLSFEYPADYTLVSIGARVDSLRTGDVIKSKWHSKGMATHAVFNMGYFERFPVIRDNLPAITIYKTGQGLIFRTRDIESEIAEDIMRSVAFYKRAYGEIPFDHLYISEIPFGLGMAFPGLLNLSWNTFYQTGIRGYDQIFRAHEVAHQWWGIEVGFDNYHDQWLSEAFAEFSGLEYLKSVSDDDERYMDVIVEITERVISNRKYVLSDGQEAGPIWLGTRTASSRTAGDYSLIIYKKGALVLRMLKYIMNDPETGNDMAFRMMMKDYYKQFRGKRATTSDFISVVSRHMNQDMQWFFEQWIYGTEIPDYEYGYHVLRNQDGRYAVNLRVTQKNVSRSFRMPVPIEITYEEDDRPPYRGSIIVGDPLAEKTFILTAEPDELIFNKDYTVLAEWDESDFEDITD